MPSLPRTGYIFLHNKWASLHRWKKMISYEKDVLSLHDLNSNSVLSFLREFLWFFFFHSLLRTVDFRFLIEQIIQKPRLLLLDTQDRV